jgi:hypothetical protein
MLALCAKGFWVRRKLVKCYLVNPIRKMIHCVMERSGLDGLINPWAINGWLERRWQMGRGICSVDEGNSWLQGALAGGLPFAAGKMGSSECWALCWHLGLRRFYKYTFQAPSFGELDLAEQSGVFPNTPEALHQFSETYIKAVAQMDLTAVWFNPGEASILAKYAPNSILSELQALEPWFASTRPWSAALAGKRVLVIHPFADTIRKQYEQHRDRIWENMPEVLPDFHLITLRSPYGFSQNSFTDWQEMLMSMEREMERIENLEGFDVALIGCGAAGLPLVAKAKAMGKAGIHVGGALQLLFGIRGRRWDVRPSFQRFFNETWCRPDLSERPQEYSKVDKGGYW